MLPNAVQVVAKLAGGSWPKRTIAVAARAPYALSSLGPARPDHHFETTGDRAW